MAAGTEGIYSLTIVRIYIANVRIYDVAIHLYPYIYVTRFGVHVGPFIMQIIMSNMKEK